MKRREFITATTAAAAGLMLAPERLAATSGTGKNKPNILFIMTDQQHAGMLSCVGNCWLSTPTMDRIAASGVRFERAYACNPVCVPSRFSLLSGHMPSAVGIGLNEDGQVADIPERIRLNTLGWLFQNAGYQTVYGGKTHVPRQMAVPANGWDLFCKDSRAQLAEDCAAFIKKPHDKPFFLFASFINPHDICYMAINDFSRSKGGTNRTNVDSRTVEAVLDEARRGDLGRFVEQHCPPLPDNFEVPTDEPACIREKYLQAREFRLYARERWPDELWRLHRWAYCRLTEMVDQKIGTLLDALEQAGLEENTLVVFTSDHGDLDSAHRLEHKSVLYEEAVRVPFLISYKGVIPQGVVDDTHLVSNGLDLLPTLCDYAGITAPSGLDGRSLRPLVETGGGEPWRECVVSESQNGRMVRTGRFKYSIYDSGENREQLVDLKKDRGEMKNLAADPRHQDVLERHRRLLAEWVEQTGDRIAAEYIVVAQR